MTWLAKLKTWLAIAGAVVLAVGAALVVGLIKGRKSAMLKARDSIAKAKTKAAVSDDVANQLEARMKNDAQVKALDSAPTPAAADAAVDSNLGGWMRDADEGSK